MAINNQASVSYTYTGARATQNNDSNITTTSLVSATSISIIKYPVGTDYIPGDIHSFIIRIENTGNTEINNVVLTDNLGQIQNPDQTLSLMDYIEGTGSFSLNNAPFSPIEPETTNPISLNIGSLNAGDVYVFIYSARTLENTGETQIQNTSSVTGSFSGEIVTAEATSTITEAQYANLVITKSQTTDNAILGEDFTYTINVLNNGNLDATDVVITDSLPEEFTVENITYTDVNGNTVTLDPSEYTLTGGQLTIPSASGTEYTVPTGEQIIFNINGRFTSLEI